MKKIIKKTLIGIFSILGILLLFLFAHNLFLSVKYKTPVVQAQLSEENIQELKFILNLKSEHGNKIWPGFSDADLPVILFNEKYEFLVSDNRPDSSWILMESQPIKDKQLFVRGADNPQAFAVKMGESYAGSLGFREKMNRDMIFGIRSQTPKVLSHLIPFFLIKVSPDMHISGLIHEIFHASQATENEQKFLLAENAHSVLQNYPFSDSAFTNYWNKEGYYLEHAIHADDNDKFIAYVDSFLIIRSQRRLSSNLDSISIQAEKQLEWLEGVAKYVESRSYTVAANMGSDYKFKENNEYWKLERRQQLPKLGRLDGDNRFYHSGAAQAFILDQLDPSWKVSIMNDGCYMEDLIRNGLSRSGYIGEAHRPHTNN